MKILHFVDAAGTDEHYVPAKSVNLVEITANTTVKVWWTNSDTNISDHHVILTVTAGQAENALLAMGEHLLDDGIAQRVPIVKFQANTHFPNSNGFGGVPNLTGVGYNAGS